MPRESLACSCLDGGALFYYSYLLSTTDLDRYSCVVGDEHRVRKKAKVVCLDYSYLMTNRRFRTHHITTVLCNCAASNERARDRGYNRHATPSTTCCNLEGSSSHRCCNKGSPTSVAIAAAAPARHERHVLLSGLPPQKSDSRYEAWDARCCRERAPRARSANKQSFRIALIRATAMFCARREFIVIFFAFGRICVRVIPPHIEAGPRVCWAVYRPPSPPPCPNHCQVTIAAYSS